MSTYDARLKIVGEAEQPLPVMIDLDDQRVVVRIDTESLADWSRSEVKVNALPDGFHIRAEGEEVLVTVEDDARFALELGLRNAPPHLRQKMAALLRDERGPIDVPGSEGHAGGGDAIPENLPPTT